MKTLITEVRNAQSRDLGDTSFDVEINHPHHGWIPYSVGGGFKSREIDNESVLARIGTTFTPYAAPTQEALDAALAVSVREERNRLLLELDDHVSNPLRWAELATATQDLWATYRIELLGVPQQTGFPQTVVWPAKVGE